MGLLTKEFFGYGRKTQSISMAPPLFWPQSESLGMFQARIFLALSLVLQKLFRISNIYYYIIDNYDLLIITNDLRGLKEERDKVPAFTELQSK